MAMYDLKARRARYFTLSSQIAHMDNAQLRARFDATLVKYRGIIMLFVDFFVSMRKNKQKDTKFPHAKLTRLLKATGFLMGNI